MAASNYQAQVIDCSGGTEGGHKDTRAFLGEHPTLRHRPARPPFDGSRPARQRLPSLPGRSSPSWLIARLERYSLVELGFVNTAIMQPLLLGSCRGGEGQGREPPGAGRQGPCARLVCGTAAGRGCSSTVRTAAGTQARHAGAGAGAPLWSRSYCSSPCSGSPTS